MNELTFEAPTEGFFGGCQTQFQIRQVGACSLNHRRDFSYVKPFFSVRCDLDISGFDFPFSLVLVL